MHRGKDNRRRESLYGKIGDCRADGRVSTFSSAWEESPLTRQLFQTAFGVGANIALLLPYSRLQENEADQIGLVLMAKAGYDPRTALAFWDRMNAQGGSRPPEFLSTHPAPESRMKRLESYLPEALKEYHPGTQ